MKTAKGRKIGSTLWLQRQLNDPYVAQGPGRGLRSRAAFKIKELDERYHLFKKGSASSIWVRRRAAGRRSRRRSSAPTADNPLIVGIDYLEMDPIDGVILLQKDFNDEDAPQALIDALGGHKADIVMSDMAAPTTGHRATDHILRIIAAGRARRRFRGARCWRRAAPSSPRCSRAVPSMSCCTC